MVNLALKKRNDIRPELAKEFARVAHELSNRNQKQFNIYNLWLTQRFRSGAWPEKDNPKAFEYLRVFKERRPSLAHPWGDLFRYRNLLDLYQTLKLSLPPDEPPPSQEAEEMIWLYKNLDTGLRLGMPRTVSAAQRYGYQTKWCVAATKGANAFWAFSAKAPLLYILAGDNKKYC